MNTRVQKALFILSMATLTTGCGPNIGGGGGGGGEPIDPLEAVRRTANQNQLCKRLGNFYWSIGDADGKLGSGQIGTAYDENTRMPIFSASKMLFGAYVIERLNGNLNPSIIEGLNFTSGYAEDGLVLCDTTDTVGSCFDNELDNFQAGRAGTFHYASGHMQKIAAQDLGLASLSEQEFADEIMAYLGTDLAVEFDAFVLGEHLGPLAAGGMQTSASAYEGFLTEVLADELVFLDYLGAHATPTQKRHSYDYSMGHWVEKFPNGDIDAYSSIGALGFYPWIDSTLEYWGVIARLDTQSPVGAADDSELCGTKMRKAFMTGIPQL